MSQKMTNSPSERYLNFTTTTSQTVYSFCLSYTYICYSILICTMLKAKCVADGWTGKACFYGANVEPPYPYTDNRSTKSVPEL
jgi:hypothetical protein